MDNSLTFLYTIFIVSILLHLISGVIVAAFVIPLQAKQAGIKNGLIKLRQQMLLKGFLSLMVIAASITALTLRFIVPDPEALRYIISSVILIHALGLLGKSTLDFKIYHQQYSDKSIDMHKRIDVLEKGDARREAKAQQ